MGSGWALYLGRSLLFVHPKLISPLRQPMVSKVNVTRTHSQNGIGWGREWRLLFGLVTREASASFSPIMRAWLQRVPGVDHWASGGRLSRVLDRAIISFSCQRNANSKQETQTGICEPLVQSSEAQDLDHWRNHRMECQHILLPAMQRYSDKVSSAKFVTFICICISSDENISLKFPSVRIDLSIYPSIHLFLFLETSGTKCLKVSANHGKSFDSSLNFTNYTSQFWTYYESFKSNTAQAMVITCKSMT